MAILAGRAATKGLGWAKPTVPRLRTSMPPTRPAARALSSSQPTEVTRGVYSCRLLRHEDWLLRLPSAGLLRSEEHPRIGSGCAAKLPAASLMTPVTCSRSPRRSMTWMISRRESPTQARVRRTKPDTVVPMSYNVQRFPARRARYVYGACTARPSSSRLTSLSRQKRRASVERT
jgi:hypothetical protein